MSCEKHPHDFDGYSPKEFVKKFVKTSYPYQKEVFELMGPEYNLEAEGDKERPSLKNPNKNRIQIASELEKLAEAIKGPVLKHMKKICEICKLYMKKNNSFPYQ